jgi:hypothetical protein
MSAGQIKVAELTGHALDAWVARAEGAPKGRTNYVAYSTSWAVGGPIIEREGMEVRPRNDSVWQSQHWKPYAIATGSTPLEAAMRAYVASKFGDAVPAEVAA